MEAGTLRHEVGWMKWKAAMIMECITKVDEDVDEEEEKAEVVMKQQVCLVSF